MRITKSDFKQGFVQIHVTDRDDLWYLSHIIESGDHIKGKASRKIKIGENENAKTTKKIFTATIEAETIELATDAQTLRINGKIRQAPEEVPHDSYQAINLQVGDECTITKQTWSVVQKQKLQESTQKQYAFLLCIFDRDEALLALTSKSGNKTLTQFKGDVPKKQQEVNITKDFHKELISLLETYNQQHSPQAIVLASPAFYKEDLLKKITSNVIKSKIVLATCSSVSQNAINEILTQPELEKTMQQSRSRIEKVLVEKLLNEIRNEAKAVYGWEQAMHAANVGAVEELLVTDALIHSKKEANQYQELDDIMKTVDSTQGKVHIISSKTESGKQLDGLGGIGAVTRYALQN